MRYSQDVLTESFIGICLAWWFNSVSGVAGVHAHGIK
jgi:hypothetical protein